MIRLGKFLGDFIKLVLGFFQRLLIREKFKSLRHTGVCTDQSKDEDQLATLINNIVSVHLASEIYPRHTTALFWPQTASHPIGLVLKIPLHHYLNLAFILKVICLFI